MVICLKPGDVSVCIDNGEKQIYSCSSSGWLLLRRISSASKLYRISWERNGKIRKPEDHMYIDVRKLPMQLLSDQLQGYARLYGQHSLKAGYICSLMSLIAQQRTTLTRCLWHLWLKWTNWCQSKVMPDFFISFRCMKEQTEQRYFNAKMEEATLANMHTLHILWWATYYLKEN